MATTYLFADRAFLMCKLKDYARRAKLFACMHLIFHIPENTLLTVRTVRLLKSIFN